MKVSVLCAVLLVVFCINAMASQCPAGRTENAFKKLGFYITGYNSSDFKLINVEFDSQNGDYFYLGEIRFSRSYVHLISRFNSRGEVAWSKSYSYQPLENTLQYSPTNQNLYYMVNMDFVGLMKVNSSSGCLISSFELPGITSDIFLWHTVCTLSYDELALFCSFTQKQDLTNIFRFDPNQLRMDRVDLNVYSSNSTILALNNHEVVYSYNISPRHLVKAKYIQTNESHYSLNEEYHQTFATDRDMIISKLGKNNETIWFTALRSGEVILFEYNATTFSLIGSKITLATNVSGSLEMGVAEDIVCISASSYPITYLIVVNATTKNVIQVYDIKPYSVLRDLSLNNGNISYANSRYHYLISPDNGFGNLTIFSKTSLYLRIFNDVDTLNETLTNHSMSVQSLSSVTVPTDEYSMARNDSESFIVSLPDKLHHNLTVSARQEFIFNISCRLDDYSKEPCEVGESDTITSLVKANCDNVQIRIKKLAVSGNVSDPFTLLLPPSIRECSSNFSITYVPCDFSNCESCSNGICDNCSEGYQWNYFTSTCEGVNVRCQTGCQSINSTLSNESTLEGNLSDAQTNATSEDPKWSSYGPTYDTSAPIITAQVFSGIGIFVGITIAFLAGTSVQNVWTLIHYLQLVLLLPLITISMSEKVRGFIVSNAFAALSLYPLSSLAVQSIPLLKHLSFDQPDEYLRTLGWSSGSTLANNIVLLMILFVLGIVHSLFYFLHRFTKNDDSRRSSFVLKVYKFFTYTVYIRTFIVVYLFTALMTVSEIKYYIKNAGDNKFEHQDEGEDNKVKGNYTSLIVSCVIFILLVLFLLLTFISWTRNKDSKKIDDGCKVRELFYGILEVPNRCLYQTQDKQNEAYKHANKRVKVYKLQNQSTEDDEHANSQDTGQALDVSLKIKLARLYYVIFLVRRLVLTLLVVLIPDSLFALKVTFILPLQIAFLAYSTLVRSFAAVKDRVVEVFNEIAILILIAFLIKYPSNDKWTSSAEDGFIGIVLSEILMLSIISIVGSTIESVKFLKSGRKSAFTDSEGKKVCMETSKNFEISNPMGDQPSQNLPAISQSSYVFIVNTRVYQDRLEKGKKETNQSLNNFMV